MKREELFEIIGEADNALLIRSEAIKRRTIWGKLGASAACLALAAVISIPFFVGGDEQIDLPKTTDNVKVIYLDKLPATAPSHEYSFAYNYTPEEIFAQETDIYKGEILSCNTLKISYNGKSEYRSIVEIKVTRVYRGMISEGDTVRLLLPWGFYFAEEKIQTSVTKVVEQMQVGMTGIFMTTPYDENSYSEYNDERLMLLDIADCGMGDGERWCFLDTENGVAMGDMWTYEENNALTKDSSFADVEAYILDMLK